MDSGYFGQAELCVYVWKRARGREREELLMEGGGRVVEGQGGCETDESIEPHRPVSSPVMLAAGSALALARPFLLSFHHAFQPSFFHHSGLGAVTVAGKRQILLEHNHLNIIVAHPQWSFGTLGTCVF